MTRSSKTLLAICIALTLSACASKPALKPDRPAPSVSNSTAATVAIQPAEPAKDPGTQFEEALTAFKAKKFDAARAGFEALAKAHPEFAGPLTNLGILDAKADANKSAVGYFTRAVAINPRNAIAYNWLGILYRQNKEYRRAETAYQQALAADPSNPSVVLNLAILYDVYLRDPTAALERYREYQRMTNNRELKVIAWIKALEASQPAAPLAAPTANSPAPKT